MDFVEYKLQLVLKQNVILTEEKSGTYVVYCQVDTLRNTKIESLQSPVLISGLKIVKVIDYYMCALVEYEVSPWLSLMLLIS